MVELHYETVARVLETWDIARRNCKNNFEKEFGTLMVNKFVELQPRARNFYGYDRNIELGQKAQTAHAHAIVEFFDGVLQVLGPDVEHLQDILNSVGKFHGKLGVIPAYFPYLGSGLIWALEETVGKDAFTEESRKAWEEVFELISSQMIRAILDGE